MATWPAPSALDAATQAFPTLTASQIARLRPGGKLRKVEPGEILFRPNDTYVPFFVLLSGAMEIVQPGIDGERPITTHSAGAFTGEISMISGQRCLVLGRVTEAGEFLEIAPDALRSVVARDAELGEIFMRAFILRRLALISKGLGNVIMLGSRHCANTLRLREFLGRNAYPYTYVDLDVDKTYQAMLDRFEVKTGDVPVVIYNGRTVLRSPSPQQLADCLGLNASIDQSQMWDLIIVGAGPSGLAAAVYAASEGLDALVVEVESPGGQAGSSSKIENYLGFPTGVSGQELANRSIAQAQKFGAQIMVAQSVVHIDTSRQPYKVILESGLKFNARAVVIATGAQYARLPIEDADACTGTGIYYNATHMEAQLCDAEEVIVVGGGNSAGQAAIFVAQSSAKVHLFVRSQKLSDSMSQYLIGRIEAHPKIEIRYRTRITGLSGAGHLEHVEWRDDALGGTKSGPIRHVFVMAGAAPRTEWLEDSFVLDNRGFIVTGPDLAAFAGGDQWPLKRPPLMLETSVPGIFAVGDTRAGSVKRVASAVGEGSMAVHLVHRYLAECAEQLP